MARFEREPTTPDEEPLDADFDGFDNEGQDPDGPCRSCPWPHQCAARGGCEAED